MSSPKQNAIDTIKVLINECDSLITKSVSSHSIQWEGFQRWKSACQESLALVFGSQSQTLINFQRVIYLPSTSAGTNQITDLVYFIQGVKTAREILEGSAFLIMAWWQDNSVPEPVKVLPFLSYGGKGGKKIAYKIKYFMNALNIQPLIAEDFPNLGLSLDDKVNLLLGIANVGIVVMTGEDKNQTGEFTARPNVIHEIGALSKLPNISNRIVYFKTDNVTLPSNIKNIAWHRLNPSNLEETYTELAKELKTFGFYL